MGSGDVTCQILRKQLHVREGGRPDPRYVPYNSCDTERNYYLYDRLVGRCSNVGAGPGTKKVPHTENSSMIVDDEGE
jgi:hypothetical protein